LSNKVAINHIFKIRDYKKNNFSRQVLNNRAEQVLPGSKGVGGRGREQGGEVAPTMYIHMNK
jgi:hypothetical protein